MTRTGTSTVSRTRTGLIGITTAAITIVIAPAATAQMPSGPLRVHPTNSRYFADAQNRAVYLTGSHTWANFQDEWSSSFVAFDFTDYLTTLQQNNHNFIRLWRQEMPQYRYSGGPMMQTAPHPWARTGPGTAGDGQPKFNLNQFNQAYFDRLRQRCIEAGQRGMYVSIMLFEGHGLSNAVEGWHSHPLNISNNINGVNGDLNSNGSGIETHTLASAAVNVVQQAYVRKVVDTVNDLDNIMYEIANESHAGSVDWQNSMIEYVHTYEASKPKQHIVWFSTTFPQIGEELWDSNAQAISPGLASAGGSYMDNPPPNDGEKIIVSDTDHLWGCGGTRAWVWKSFTRGLHPIFMDGWDGTSCGPQLDIRQQLGHARSFAARMNLANAVPSGSGGLANTGYCLADAGDAYLVYAPGGGTITLNLSQASGSLLVEWFNPTTAQHIAGQNVAGGGTRTFNPPFGGESVLFVYRQIQGAIGDTNGDGVVNVDDLVQVVMSWVCAADAQPM